jgi:hypothetical protein
MTNKLPTRQDEEWPDDLTEEEEEELFELLLGKDLPKEEKNETQD